MELAGKVAIVTGAAVRLGQTIALALGRAGCGVLVHYHRSAAPARATADELAELGIPVALAQGDLADARTAGMLVERARAELGRVDVLVNSAALFLPGGLAETDLDTWQRQLDLNLRAPFLLAQAFAAAVPAEGRGKIVNLNDARIHRPGSDHLAYRLTKAGLHALTLNLAVELAPRITVNELALGAILPPVDADPHHLDRVRARIPLRVSGSPNSVADALLWLLADDFLTGVSIPLDGGEFL